MRIKEAIFILIIFVVMMSVVFQWSYEASTSTSHLPVKVSNYSVMNQPSNFRVLWMKPDAYAFYDDAAIMLAATNDRIVFLGGFSQTEPYSLVGINAETGSIEWTKLDEKNTSRGSKLSVFANDHLIYVIFDSIWRVPADASFGAVMVRAYQSDSGNLVWRRSIKGASSINSLMITEATIGIDGNDSENYYVLDAQTGQIVETRSKKEEDFLWFSKDGILYEGTRFHAVQAIELETGEMLWQSSLAMVFQHPPILNDGVLLLRSGGSSSEGIVYALDIQTGEILWQHAGVVSNVAAENSIAYLLTLDAQLIAVNVRTGDILDAVDFSTSEFVLQDSNSFRHGFSVAVLEDIVSIHLGDSQQLFAFRFLPDS